MFASAAPRLRAPDTFDGEKTLPLRRSDIDFNGHVHNTKYLDFALEALPDSVPRDAFTGIRMIYPKAVKDANSVTLKYTLTDTGYSLKPILDAMVDWGTDYQQKNADQGGQEKEQKEQGEQA